MPYFIIKLKISKEVFKKLSTVKLTASQENYLETIYFLAKDHEFTRAIDISKKLEVGKSSVTEALRVLASKKLINHSPYGTVTLTLEGNNLAKEVVLKHETLYRFLSDILGVERGEAMENACRIEHVISQNVLKKLIAFVEFSREFYFKNSNFVEEFESFYKKKKE